MRVNLIDNYQCQIRILDTLRGESQATRSRFEVARSEYRQQLRQAEQLGLHGRHTCAVVLPGHQGGSWLESARTLRPLPPAITLRQITVATESDLESLGAAIKF